MRVILAGGGTAGHINPALAIADVIKSRCPGSSILFIGNPGSLEQKLVTKAGFDFEPVRTMGLKRSLSPKNLKSLSLFLAAQRRTKEIIKQFKPQAVIGTGGYVSAPVIMAANKCGVKTFIHEQNAYPGVASKMLSRYADIVFISFESSKKYFTKAKKIVLCGNPLRDDIIFADRTAARKKLGLKEGDFYIVSFAGSLGAREVNKMFIPFILKNYKSGDFYHTHATGTYGFRWMPQQLKEGGFDISDNSRINVMEYIYDMPLHLAACDLVICRSGAISIGEITALGLCSILIPSPNVTHNHQYYNALSLSERGAAFMVEEKDMSADLIYNKALEFKSNPALLKQVGKKAAQMALIGAETTIYESVHSAIKDKGYV